MVAPKPPTMRRSPIIPKPSKWDNLEYNREYWDTYAKEWDKKKVGMDNADIVTEAQRVAYFQVLGDEWGNKTDVKKIVEEYIYPFIIQESIVGEIGVGGGRIASMVALHVKELYCFDISAKMLKKARGTLSYYTHVKYILLDQPKFSADLKEKFDFVYSFDVFVHLDLHMMWKYFNEIRHILKVDGKAFLHTTNLKAPDGWKHFASQKHYSVQHHYFISPEIIQILAEHAGLKIIKESNIDNSNFYLNRDYLFILQKTTNITPAIIQGLLNIQFCYANW